MELHRDLGIPVAATNDSHYIMKEHAPLQDILICIHTNTNVNDPKRLKMDEDSYYLRSMEEMAALYPDTPDAISNTMRIAEMCDLEFDFNRMHLPEFPGPKGMDADEYLAKLCWEGLRRRIDRPGEEEEARLKYELGGDRADAVRQLLPGRLGHSPVRVGKGHSVRRPGQRGGEPRALLSGRD